MKNKENTAQIDWRIINWMRGFAALYVCFGHAVFMLFTDERQYTAAGHPKSAWTPWEWLNMKIFQHAIIGQEVVIVFLILSGFAIAHSLKENTQIAAFYKRRFVRLYPTFLLGISWALFAYYLIKIFAPAIYFFPSEGNPAMQMYYHRFTYLPDFFLNLIYLPNNNLLTTQYWSLTFEVIFYIAAPFIFRHLKISGMIILTAYVAGIFLFGNTLFSIHQGQVLFRFMVEYGVYFLVGILFYRYKDELINRFVFGKAATFILAVVLFEAVILLKGYVFGGTSSRVTFAVIVLFTYVMLFGSLKHGTRIPGLEQLGNYSYTLYVTHGATLFMFKIITYRLGMNYHHVNSASLWIAGVAVSVLAAYGLYFLAEKPSIRFLEQQRRGRMKQPVAAMPVMAERA